jgi:hypothetical protein
VPDVYLDGWALLNHETPSWAPLQEWERAINDGGLFLDRWGNMAVQWDWTAADLFDPWREGGQGGLVWQLNGEEVEALSKDQARTEGGRTIKRRKRKIF